MGGEQWLISASLTDWMTGLPQTTSICFNPPLFFPFLFLFFFSPFVLAHIRRAWCFWACWLKKVLEEETPVLSWWLCSVAGFSMDMMQITWETKGLFCVSYFCCEQDRIGQNRTEQNRTEQYHWKAHTKMMKFNFLTSPGQDTRALSKGLLNRHGAYNTCNPGPVKKCYSPIQTSPGTVRCHCLLFCHRLLGGKDQHLPLTFSLFFLVSLTR